MDKKTFYTIIIGMVVIVVLAFFGRLIYDIGYTSGVNATLTDANKSIKSGHIIKL